MADEKLKAFDEDSFRHFIDAVKGMAASGGVREDPTLDPDTGGLTGVPGMYNTFPITLTLLARSAQQNGVNIWQALMSSGDGGGVDSEALLKAMEQYVSAHLSAVDNYLWAETDVNDTAGVKSLFDETREGYVLPIEQDLGKFGSFFESTVLGYLLDSLDEFAASTGDTFEDLVRKRDYPGLNFVHDMRGASGGSGDVPIATTETPGIVKPDGTTVTVDESGVLSALAASGGPAIVETVDHITQEDLDGGFGITDGNYQERVGTTLYVLGEGAGETPDSLSAPWCMQTVDVVDMSPLPVRPLNVRQLYVDAENVVHNRQLVAANADASFDSLETKSDDTLAKTAQLPKAATTSKAGLVKPDGTSITVTGDGTISATGVDVTALAEDETFLDALAGSDTFANSLESNPTVLYALANSTEFGEVFARNEPFVNYLARNDTFLNYLAGSETFVTSLANNDTFFNSLIYNSGFIESLVAKLPVVSATTNGLAPKIPSE